MPIPSATTVVLKKLTNGNLHTMKKLFSLCLGLVSLFSLASCNKNDDDDNAAPESYQLTGRIDPARTTIAGANLTAAVFTVIYNVDNSFGEDQALLSGNLRMTGYTGVTVTTTSTGSGANTVYTHAADTVNIFTPAAEGGAVTNLFNQPAVYTGSSNNPNNAFSTYNTAYTSFRNVQPAFELSVNNFPYTVEALQTLKAGQGSIKIGKGANYVTVIFDNVVKI